MNGELLPRVLVLAFSLLHAALVRSRAERPSVSYTKVTAEYMDMTDGPREIGTKASFCAPVL